MFLESLQRISSATERYLFYKTHRLQINRELQRKAAREAANLRDNLTLFATTVKASQKDLAGVLELNQSEVSRILRGERGISSAVEGKIKLL
jgi:hypothetical protein